MEEKSALREAELSHSLAGTLNWGQGTKSSGSPKQQFTGQRTSEEGDAERENSGDLHKVPLEYSDEYWSAQAHEETTWGWRKDELKGLKVTVPSGHTG